MHRVDPCLISSAPISTGAIDLLSIVLLPNLVVPGHFYALFCTSRLVEWTALPRPTLSCQTRLV